jgi:hypothetical protein
MPLWNSAARKDVVVKVTCIVVDRSGEMTAQLDPSDVLLRMNVRHIDQGVQMHIGAQ